MIFSTTMEQGQLMTSPPHQDQQNMELLLPPGFRFHPTDEELVTHYLCRKVSDANFRPRAIAEVDLNKCEPWDLPWKATMGEKEWYFFCVRDRKYPTGLRTNRATESGYWKATGKDREVRREGSALVGMKKTLVFYRGRAPKGEKTGWVMHEYRLEGKYHQSASFLYNPSSSKSAKNDWVLCRVFEKGPEGKRPQASESPGLWSGSYSAPSFSTALLPPLLADSPSDAAPVTTTAQHVPCFSNANGDGYLGAALLTAGSAGCPCSLSDGLRGTGGSQCPFSMLGSGLMIKDGGEFMGPSAGMAQSNAEISSLLSGNGLQRRWLGGGELDEHSAGALVGVDEDCLWNY